MSREKLGIDVARSIYHSDIAIVSSIIKDGVQDRDELIRKYAAETNRTYELAEKCISILEGRDEVGYYVAKTHKDVGFATYLFVPWNGKRAFEPSRYYKDTKNYFRRHFRKSNGLGMNTSLLCPSEDEKAATN